VETQKEKNWWAKYRYFFVEEVVALFLGIAFVFLNMGISETWVELLAILIPTIWTILILHRLFLKSNIDAIKNDVFVIRNTHYSIMDNIDEIHRDIEAVKYLQQLIDSSKSTEIKDLINEYGKQSPPECNQLKNFLLVDCSKKIKELCQIGRVENVPPELSFPITIDALKNIQPGDEIFAIDFLKPGEWNYDVSPEGWGKYIEANKNAAKITSVQRIFVVEDDKWKPETKLSDEETKIYKYIIDIIGKHTIIDDKNNITNIGLHAFMINKEEYEQTFVKQQNYIQMKHGPEHVDHVLGKGFFVIYRKEKRTSMGVIDEFYTNTDTLGGDVTIYRTTVTYAEKDINDLNKAFRTVRAHILNNHQCSLEKLASDSQNGKSVGRNQEHQTRSLGHDSRDETTRRGNQNPKNTNSGSKKE
jgi:hypothetical protein